MAGSGLRLSAAINTPTNRDKDQASRRRTDLVVSDDLENGKAKKIFKVASKGLLGIENEVQKKESKVHQKFRLLVLGMCLCQGAFTVLSMYLNLSDRKASVILDSWIRNHRQKRISNVSNSTLDIDVATSLPKRSVRQINVDPGPLSCNKSVCAAPGGWEFRCVSLTPPPTEGGLSPPHPACLNASRSAQNCPPGGWLCADMSLPAAAGIFLSAREPDEILGPVEGDDEEDPADGGNRTAVIAVIAATTTRGQQAPTLASVPLLSTLVPSMLDTAEPGFEYWLMVAYDVGDPFYDNRTARAAAQALFAARAADARAATGVTARLALVRFLNAQRKPGPAFNYVAAAAFRDGADYFYRVNDDSIFVSPWARSLVGVLLAFRPPNLGVVGPTCLEGKRSILTHDFTHRAHQRLFDTYYPPALADWWMDDWITAVYPGSNTYRHRGVVVRHRLFHHRYKIDKSHRLLLPSILLATRRAVRDAIEACSPGPCPLLRAAGDRPPPAGVGPARLDRRSFRDYDLHFAILRNVSALANRSLAHNMSSLRLAAAAANAAAAAGGRGKRRPRERRPRPRLLRPEAAGAPGGQAERLAGQDSR